MLRFKINKMDLLIAIYFFAIAMAELMGGKTFPFQIGSLKLNASVAIFLFPLVFTINDVITEVYGKERTRSIIRSAILGIFLIFIFSLFATTLPPSQRFTAREEAYDVIFGLSARIAAASLIAFTLAEFLDVLVFSKIRERLGKSKLWLRNNLSNIISQFVDTTVFMFLAFYALNRPFDDNLQFLISLIIPYWLLKSFASILETPLVYIGVNWLKKDLPAGRQGKKE